MAYDIGTGISEGLGAIGQGLVTRKERQEEREFALGQAEIIEEDLYTQYQDLLNTGAGEGQVKAAQTEYEKWAKDTSDEHSTKKIEGMIAEYDKKGLRKTRRLTNESLRLKNELARTENPLLIETKRKQITQLDNAIAEYDYKADKRKEWASFPGALKGIVETPLPDEDEKWIDPGREIEGWQGTPWARPGQLEAADQPLPAGLDEAGYRITGEDAEASAEHYYERAENPYAELLDRNAFALRPSTPAVIAADEPLQQGADRPMQEDFYQYQPGTFRDPTASEMSARAQQYLAMRASDIGPENYAAAEAHVQSRYPRSIPGAPITLGGEETNKYVAAGTVQTKPYDGGRMDLPGETYFKGTSTVIDPVTGHPTTTVSHGAGRDPRTIPDARAYAGENADLTFRSELALSDQEAKEFRTQGADVHHGVNMLQRALDLDAQLTPAQRRLPIPNEKRVQIQAILNTLRGKLRLAIIGPGAVSEYEQKILQEVIGNPTKFWQWDANSRGRLESLQKIMTQGLKFRGQTIGLWDYDHQLAEGEVRGITPATRAEMESAQRDYDQRILDNNPPTDSSQVPSGRQFGSEDLALQANLPSGTVVYIRDDTNAQLVPFSIP